MTDRAFAFADHAAHFAPHIGRSIPGLEDLRTDCVAFSTRFVQPATTVLDVGCSTGELLRRLRDANAGVEGVGYLGIDAEPSFGVHWRQVAARDVRFRVGDVRSADVFHDLSMVTSLFTLQFLPFRDRVPVLKKIYDGLVDGGALVVSEKVLANGARMQDVLNGHYYDFKRQHFSTAEIMDKEKGLRRQMQLWEEPQLNGALCQAGFCPENIQRFWQRSFFMGFLAVKSVPVNVVPIRARDALDSVPRA